MEKIINVDSTFENMRLDRLLRNHLGKLPQGLIEKNLRNGKIKLNNKKVKSSTKVKKNDKINIFNFEFKNKVDKKIDKYKPSNEIIKENESLLIENNDDFIVLNKSSGISVQGGTKSKKNLIDIFTKSKFFENTKPFSVHRLDKDTSGVFIIAKNRETAQLLTSLFRLRKVHKTYLAICNGEIDRMNGILKNDLVRYDNKKKIVEKAETIFKVIDKNQNSSLVKMKPVTGRKHQLRKHLFMIGHSILGDKKYRTNNNIKSINKNLMLHSYEIKFIIRDTKFTFRASLPDYFKKMIKVKRLNFQY
ncbi:MAG: RluA family pseudouridine synthase [Candidatus Pelagibacter sp.]